MEATHGHWRVLGVSVQGASHRRNGTPCQDAHRWSSGPGEVLVTAVADGAGSAPLAEVGAGCAAGAAVDRAAQRLFEAVPVADADWETLLRDVFQVARTAVETASAERGQAAREPATTLLVAIATADRVVAGQVGDGAIVVRLADSSLLALTRPQVHEYLNETTFLTADDALARLQLTVYPAPATALMVLSDGLQMLALKMPQGEPHATFFNPLLQFVSSAPDLTRAGEQLQSFLQSPRIMDRTDDDLTLILAVRAAAPTTGAG